MSSLSFSPDASQDLDDIYNYIAQRDPRAAARLIADIEQRCRTLAQFPGTGRSREDLSPGLRQSTIRGYAILYRPRNSGVEIARVVHGARDLPSLYYP